MNLKIAVMSALAAVAMGDGPVHPAPHHAPAPYHAPAPAYKPAPAPYHAPAPAPYHAPAPKYGAAPHAYKEEKLAPQPFAYQYGVKDDYSGANFEKVENQDAYGNLEGSYRVALPDGRTQIVTYHADHENGYVADVSYEGTAIYPPEPKEGYGHAAPHHGPPAAYRPAPAPQYHAAPAPKYHPAPAPKYAPAPAPKYVPAPAPKYAPA